MRPCTVHYVVSSEDAIVLGRHFYSSLTISSLVFGIVHTFITGNFVTNDNHYHTHSLIRRLFYMWYKFFDAVKDQQNKDEFAFTKVVNAYLFNYEFLNLFKTRSLSIQVKGKILIN